MRVPGYAQSPPSMRLLGGTEALVDALQAEVPAAASAPPARCAASGRRRAGAPDECGRPGARPPLAGRACAAGPAPAPGRGAVGLAATIACRFAHCVATHAHLDSAHARIRRCVRNALLARAGLSGQARSARGPLAEIRRPVAARRGAALFGFVGVPAAVRATVSEDVLRQHCQSPTGTAVSARQRHTRWPTPSRIATQDPLTATAQDQSSTGHHAASPAAFASEGVLGEARRGHRQRVVAADTPGYLAGALDAAQRGLHALGIPQAQLL